MLVLAAHIVIALLSGLVLLLALSDGLASALISVDQGAHVATKDWDAVAAAIRARLVDIDMTQAQLAARAGVALMTVRELQHNLRPRRRNPRTLAAVSQALGWPPDRLARIVEGEQVTPRATETVVLAELAAVKAELHATARRLDKIEQHIGLGRS